MSTGATYTVHQTPSNIVDHEHLAFLRQHLEQEGTRAVVVGFGEYAKHLVNYYPDRIAAIYDPRPMLNSVKFRGVPVLDAPEHAHPVNMILAGEYGLLYDYLPKVIDLYPGGRIVIPPRMNYKTSNDINVFEQEEIYKHIKIIEHDAPTSMMQKEKINFLLELLRFGLTKPGIVLEMGSWQGGSTWYMAKTLAYLGETRKLYAMDLFEDHMMDPTATMCSDEIRIRMNSAYGHFEMIQGLVDDPEKLAQLNDQPICFAHMDLGPQPVALDYIWNHLSPGAPLLLDNYGHLGAPPWAFDRYIESKGSRVIRFPWSEQGLVFKNA
ncbi:class I SAM-dependent methyltransferase [Methylobacterium sp. J-090]|uniref:class I SAM-dependent methyltransferase n=1 Tax=Methylobacterium sp. J-090 TaxID=2836666 RepID=UPI001FB8FE51|nr:class I SAM-dependent methyltransferase [Methylobacterium sp. J-090]MCJ2081502.1 class I SAM-dependent methyltransferase [Methylobacterium sp. J-090]